MTVHFRTRKKSRQAVSISRMTALAFLGIILGGAALLSLPAASRDGRSAGLLVSLFTATSATCVTGLVLADTWTQWNAFGQTVILIMIEIGGLGFMSAASLAYFSFRRRISFQQQLVMAEAIGAQSMGNIVTHQKRLITRAFAVEGIGAILLTLRFMTEYSFPQALKLGVFHSVSAFCNAGFDILGFRAPGASLMTYQQDPVICLVLSALVILGGLGFLVWDEVIRERKPGKWSVYTKLVMITSGALLLLGMLLVALLEWTNPETLGPFSVPGKLLASFFQSVTLRTAGFAALDQGKLTEAGKAVSIFFMLIGGSSGSTAGGLKTVTFIVLLMFLWNRMRGHSTVSVFHRTISNDHVMNAIQIFILMISLRFDAYIISKARKSIKKSGLFDCLDTPSAGRLIHDAGDQSNAIPGGCVKHAAIVHSDFGDGSNFIGARPQLCGQDDFVARLQCVDFSEMVCDDPVVSGKGDIAIPDARVCKVACAACQGRVVRSLIDIDCQADRGNCQHADTAVAVIQIAGDFRIGRGCESGADSKRV